jgi:hypothetical protein
VANYDFRLRLQICDDHHDDVGDVGGGGGDDSSSSRCSSLAFAALCWWSLAVTPSIKYHNLYSKIGQDA